jgi:diguanylate cyclase (GGDEF)-like protein
MIISNDESSVRIGKCKTDETMENRQKHIHIEKIKLLYLHSLIPAVLSAVASFFVVAALWTSANHHHLLIWLSLTLFFAIYRITLILNFKRSNLQGDQILAWERPYAITLIMVFIIWGVGLLLIMPKDNLTSIFIVNTFSVGLAGAAISWYSPIRYLQTTTISIALLPMIVVLLSIGHPETLWVGIAACCMFVSCMITSVILQNTLNGNLELAYDLERAIQNAEQIASTDMLTGLNNRRAFFDEAVTQFAKCKATDIPVSLIMFDVDHFKKVNDVYGHAVGDLVLKHVAQLLLNNLRLTDISARFGGEEFAILLPNCTAEEAQIVAEKLRGLIADTPTHTDSSQIIDLTASFGVADVGKTLDEMLNYADQAMYQAKNCGRNLVGVYMPSTVFISHKPKRTRPSNRVATKPDTLTEPLSYGSSPLQN